MSWSFFLYFLILLCNFGERLDVFGFLFNKTFSIHMFTNQFSHDKENTKLNGQRCSIGVNSYSVSALNTWLGCDFEMRLLSLRAVFTVIHIIVNKIRSIKYRWTSFLTLLFNNQMHLFFGFLNVRGLKFNFIEDRYI